MDSVLVCINYHASSDNRIKIVTMQLNSDETAAIKISWLKQSTKYF